MDYSVSVSLDVFLMLSNFALYFKGNLIALNIENRRIQSIQKQTAGSSPAMGDEGTNCSA